MLGREGERVGRDRQPYRDSACHILLVPQSFAGFVSPGPSVKKGAGSMRVVLRGGRLPGSLTGSPVLRSPHLYISGGPSFVPGEAWQAAPRKTAYLGSCTVCLWPGPWSAG